MRGSPSVAIQTARRVPVSSHRASHSRTGPDARSTATIERPRSAVAEGDDVGVRVAAVSVATVGTGVGRLGAVVGDPLDGGLAECAAPADEVGEVDGTETADS